MARRVTARPIAEHLTVLTRVSNQISVNEAIPIPRRRRMIRLIQDLNRELQEQVAEEMRSPVVVPLKKSRSAQT